MVLPSVSQKMKCGQEEPRDLAKTTELNNGTASTGTLVPASWPGAVSTISHASGLQSRLTAVPDLQLKSCLLSPELVAVARGVEASQGLA